MKVKPTSVVLWLLSLAVFGVVVLYGLMVKATLEDSPLGLTSCIEGSRYGFGDKIWAWTCKQVLFHKDFSPEEVKELNLQAGALFPVLTDDPIEAEAALKRFLSQGVDINARDTRVETHWMALHVMASGGTPWQVSLLLKYGARLDLRDFRGKTPLDMARDMQQRFPKPRQLEIIRILEEAERKAAEQK